MGRKGKPLALKARVTIDYKDDPEAYERLLKLLSVALEIANMDEEQAKKYQEAFLKTL